MSTRSRTGLIAFGITGGLALSIVLIILGTEKTGEKERDKAAEADALEWVVKVGGLVTRRDSDRQIVSVTFGSDDKVTDDGLKHLAAFRALIIVSLKGKQITDDGLKHLAKLKLSQLHLTAPKVTDAGIKSVASIQGLQTLLIQDMAITDVGLANLGTCKSLKMLWIGGTKVTKDGIASLQRKLPDCDIRDLGK